VSPFQLKDYLQPNHIDWTILPEDISYHTADSKVVYCGSNATLVEPFFQKLWLKKCFRQASKQAHVYTNAHLLPRGTRFGLLFNELFKPSQKVEDALTLHTSKLQGGYYTMSLRFQRLLGDFVERDGVDISPEEQQQLMTRCVQKIAELRNTLDDTKKVVLMSDSIRFLEYAASQLDFIYYIPGKVQHIDFYKETPEDVNIKLFVDILMISRAEKAFLLQTGKMYNSGFPRRAAQVGNIPFRHIRF
jgi:hypothetical protein